MNTAAPEIVVLAEAEVPSLEALFAGLGWVPGADGRWARADAQAWVAVRRRDARFVALEVGGPDAALTRDDLGSALRLWDEVDLMTALAAAATPEELLGWLAALGAFARGPEQRSTRALIEGLLASERPEFAAAMAGSLHDARWPSLRGSLQALAARLPALAPACAQALASIDGASRQNPGP